MKKNYLFVLFATLFCFNSLYSQKFIYDVENFTYFDNKVVHRPAHTRSCYFANRLTALAGIGLGDVAGAYHSLYAGVGYTQPFGDNYKQFDVRPMVYYNFTQGGASFFCGIFPYSKMINSLPSLMRTGSSDYNTPNMQGFLYQYKYEKGSVEALLDWQQLRTERQGNRFNFAINGRHTFIDADIKSYVSFFAQWERSEHRDSAIVDDVYGLDVDNIKIMPSLTVDFSKNTPFRALNVNIGYLFAYQNHKYLAANHTAHAMTFDCQVAWEMLSLKNSLFFSNRSISPLSSLAPELTISMGDVNYTLGLYNKTELSCDIVSTHRFNLRAAVCMHTINNYKVGFQQKLTARISI